MAISPKVAEEAHRSLAEKGTAEQLLVCPVLISTERVEGTEVYGAGNRHIGEIHHLMIERVSGRVAYAVMSFGGFLGMGLDFQPVPWKALQFDTALNGYRTDITREQIESAPPYKDHDGFDWCDDEWHARMHEHYRTEPSYFGFD